MPSNRGQNSGCPWGLFTGREGDRAFWCVGNALYGDYRDNVRLVQTESWLVFAWLKFAFDIGIRS